MTEGWLHDDYLILFTESEIEDISQRHRIARYLPGYVIAGLRGWDDFILRDENGHFHTVPTVPLVQEFIAPFNMPKSLPLKVDPRFSGKIKWYVHPIVFGGDVNSPENLVWVDHQQHGELVSWWNEKYRELKFI